MANENEARAAREVYDTLCNTLTSMEWNFDRDDEKLRVTFGVQGDDIPMHFVIAIDEDRQLVRLISFLPFEFGEDKRVEGSVATNQINYSLAEGCFDFGLNDGRPIFRVTTSFRESLVGDEMFRYMIHLACYTVDRYNDQLEALSNGTLTIQKFLEDN